MGRPSPPPDSPPLVLEALEALSCMDAYTKRIGVFPDSIGCILSDWPVRMGGPGLSFDETEAVVHDLRAAFWRRSFRCFQDAASLRFWVYSGDPAEALPDDPEGIRATAINEEEKEENNQVPGCDSANQGLCSE